MTAIWLCHPIGHKVSESDPKNKKKMNKKKKMKKEKTNIEGSTMKDQKGGQKFTEH